MLFSAFMEGEIATPKSKLMAHRVTVESHGPIMYDIIQDAERLSVVMVCKLNMRFPIIRDIHDPSVSKVTTKQLN